jgi:3-methyladenine DNA glycosylase AlkD
VTGRVAVPTEVAALVHELRAGLAAAGDPLAAPTMQAYMKSDLPYHGVKAPACRAVFRAGIAAHPLPDRAAWLAAVRLLWDGATHREELYAALAVARDRRYRAYRTPEVLPHYRDLVVSGAWWDVVDDIATHLVGPLLLAHPAETAPVVRAWATDEDRWLRRTAVICQVGAKERTDLDLLTAAIDANLDDGDFFLRKAIGWALRQYARTDPGWVQQVVDDRADRLSPLSRREALKHVGPLPRPA